MIISIIRNVCTSVIFNGVQDKYKLNCQRYVRYFYIFKERSAFIKFFKYNKSVAMNKVNGTWCAMLDDISKIWQSATHKDWRCWM